MMATCYDCERLGVGCDGMIPPPEYSSRIEEYCERFVPASWRRDMFKDSGKKRLSGPPR